MKLKFGVFLDPTYLPSAYTSFKKLTLEAERLGYDSLWISDHLMAGNKPIIECFTTLSSFASITKMIRLGTLVTCISYRRPSILAKMASTLDVISDGRLEFGIGAGWDEEEYQAYGIPFPKPSIRIAQMKEGIEIIKKMWTEEKPSFRGNYFSIDRAYCEPKPLQKPHPPITIGGSGEKLLLKVVAECADRSNFLGSTTEFAHRLRVLETHCAKVGRDYNEIAKSWFGRVMISEDRQELIDMLKKLYFSGKISTRFLVPQSFEKWFEKIKNEGLIGTPSECLTKIKKYADLGVTHFMLSFLDHPSTYGMKLFANEIKGRL